MTRGTIIAEGGNGTTFTLRSGKRDFTIQKKHAAPGEFDRIKATSSVEFDIDETHKDVQLGSVRVIAFPPYRFVPVNVDVAICDAPVWHDGSGGSELFSGEILCTLCALTPLLPGNARYSVEESRDQWVAQFGVFEQGKKIAEPLRFRDDKGGERVVIAGTALKGMIRHSLAALLSSPMERVGERHFTYRPNFGHAKNRRYECHPAVVTQSDPTGTQVAVLPQPRAGVFLHGTAPSTLRTKKFSLKPGSPVIGGVSELAYRTKNGVTDYSRIEYSPTGFIDFNHVALCYKGGIDGEGLLARIASNPVATHGEALVRSHHYPAAPKPGGEVPVDQKVMAKYLQTQRVLADDQHGHLTNSHPSSKKWDPDDPNRQLNLKDLQRAIKASTDLRQDQLVYVEAKISGGTPDIKSIGHHYQYRWAYSSSIRMKDGKLRTCLAPTATESKPDDAGAPAELSAARLLFGFVHSGVCPIGKGVYERLAGRVAINNALSVGVPKFLEQNAGPCIPLSILGQPKPSAWEFYLDQSGKTPATYGDLLGDSGGDLAGRKFYLHQPSVQDAKAIKAVGEDVQSKQATLARFVCALGTEFKFVVRFSQLREWELGALIAVLEPQRLADGDSVPATASGAKSCHDAPPPYAHKLGLGRPLGMGSVAIKIDKVLAETSTDCKARIDKAVKEPTNRDREPAPTDFKDRIDEAVREFRSRCDTSLKQTVKRWLDVHRYVDRGRFEYPKAWTKVNDKRIETIYAWHTELRRRYATLRRENNNENEMEKLQREIRAAHNIPSPK